MTLSGTRSSPCQCPWASNCRGPSRSDRSRDEDPGRRPPRDRAIVCKPPPSARARGPRAAAPPLDRIVPPPCPYRSSTGGMSRPRGPSPASCRTASRAGDVVSASRWRASAIVHVVLIDVSSGEQPDRPRERTRGRRTPRDQATVRKPPPSAPWPRFSRPSTGCAGRRAHRRSHGPRRLGVALARIRHRPRRPDRCLQQPHSRRSRDHPQTASVGTGSRSSRGFAAARPHRPAAMPGPVFGRGHVAAAGPSPSSCRTASRSIDGSGCAGRRARPRRRCGLDSLGHHPASLIVAAPAFARTGHVGPA